MRTLRPVLQSEAAECSLACLCMVAQAHGLHITLTQLRSQFSVGLKGATLQQLIEVSAQLGFSARALRLEMDELEQLHTPCILHWNLNHFVVLKKVGADSVVILDPAQGERRISRGAMGQHFTGVALELQPTTSFQQQPRPPRLRLEQLTGRVRGLAPALGSLFAVALVLECFAVAGPMFNQMIVDQAIGSHDVELLTVLALGFGVLLVVQTGLHLLRGWMVTSLTQTVSLQWVSNVFSHLMRLPVEWFERRHLGDITSRFASVQPLQRTLTTGLVEAVLDGLMVLVALTMMLLYAPQLTAIVVGAAFLYALVRWIGQYPLRETAAQRSVWASREHSHFLETLRAITPLKLFGREADRRAQWENLRVEVQNQEARAAGQQLWFGAANAVIFGLENLLVWWMAARMIMNSAGPHPDSSGAFTIGMMFAFVAYKSQFTQRLVALVHYLMQLRLLGVDTERLSDIVLSAPEQPARGLATTAHNAQQLSATLELRNVSFRYASNQPWILRHANLTIPAGQCLALTGRSGAGKTTVLKLLLGILQPTEGQVLYGGVPIEDLGVAHVRQQIGTVLQDDVLLTGSLADNIAFFDSEPDMDRVRRCAEQAHIHEDIERMPMGYHSLVGDLGTGLSGGQKQRLLLARALYRQPKVLALDEATSHLDGPNEQAINRVLSDMALTRVFIAHRAESIAAAQRVVLLVDGRIQELSSVQPKSPAPVAWSRSLSLPPASARVRAQARAWAWA